MIKLKTKNDIKILREGGLKLAKILEQLKSATHEGVTTEELELLAEDLIKKIGGKPSFKDYKSGSGAKPFPTVLCVSVNDEIVHSPAIPAKKLKSGDIVGIDIGMVYPFGESNKKIKGYYTDMAITIPIGKISKKAEKLIKTTKEALNLAIDQVKPGNRLSDIGKVIEKRAKAENFSVVRDLVGHGVGFAVHEEPMVPNYVPKEESWKDEFLRPGMVFAIEPMINEGSHEIIVDKKDGLTIRTRDGKLSAHFEHTVAVTEDGNIVITSL